jgi:HlyD family secretion protein
VSRSRVITIALIVAVALGGAWLWWSRGRSEQVRYRTAGVERGAIEAVVSATGTVQPVVQVDVGSQVSGTVSKLHADYNSRVREGQVLCEIEPSSFKARVAQAEAAVARAEAAVKEAKLQLDRANELLPQKYVSQSDVDEAESTLQQRQADLKQARAQLEAAQVDLNNTTIRSPIEGVVIARAVDLGQTVAASLQAPKLFTIANDLTQMQVETRIDEADIGQIRPGLPVIFSVDAFPDQQFEGQVAQVRLEPITEQNVVTYTTVIATANHDLRLRPGMTANVSVRVANRDDVLKIPNSALRFRPPPEAMKKAANATHATADARKPGTEGTAAAADAPPMAAGVPQAGAAKSAAAPEKGAGAKKAGGGAAAKAGAPKAGGASAANDPDRAALEKRMRDRGMPDDMIQSILERRDQAVAEMRAQGLSDDEIRERLRQRMEQMRNGGGGGGTMGSSPPSFKNFGKQGEAPAGKHVASSETGPVVMGTMGDAVMKPGAVYVLRDGEPVRVPLMTGLTDGAYTEVKSDDLKAGDAVIIGVEAGKTASNLQPPPGMGGPFGGGGGGARPSGGGARTR